MAETPDNHFDRAEALEISVASRLDDWFVAEVLPLETSLRKFLRRGWRNEADIRDLCQDVYVAVYEAAAREIPTSARAFVFTVARNVVADRVRRAQIVPIEAVADLEALGVTVDEPGPERTAIARQDLRKLQAALERLPQRWREVVVMRKVQGLSLPEIVTRLGIAERTVSQHLTSGIAALANIFHDDPTDQGDKS
ncbi:MAG TPA: sigma-70 family RNA polymerase sigma factor [Rhizomicrobium sp.]|nr:sigma-70 family RNA polymerase sigma factor [Rhizomicrobium sp.]